MAVTVRVPPHRLSRPGALSVPALLLVLVGLGNAAAADLVDPTAPPRPGLGLAAPASLAAGATSGAAGSTTPAAAPAVVVQTIVFSPRRRFAVLNGQEVREGDRFQGARVVAIAPDTVSLELAGQRAILRIHPDANRQFALNPSAAASAGAGTAKP